MELFPNQEKFGCRFNSMLLQFECDTNEHDYDSNGEPVELETGYHDPDWEEHRVVLLHRLLPSLDAA